jgi:hypothetical protein
MFASSRAVVPVFGPTLLHFVLDPVVTGRGFT